jgi:sec-independent protein translocase protein TatC
MRPGKTDEIKPLSHHLQELRKRLLICLGVVAIAAAAAYVFYDPVVINIVRGPIDGLNENSGNPFALDNPVIRTLRSKLEFPDLSLHYIGPVEAFGVKLKVSLLTGFLVSAPLILIQLWMFISVGLTGRERRISRFLIPALLLFFCGIAASYFFVVPAGLAFLISLSGSLIPLLTISKYVSLVLVLVIAFGLIFEMPIVVVFVTRIGLITPQDLSAKRRYVIVAVFILAALLTPPDVFTQLALAVPVILLFELSVLAARMLSRDSGHLHSEGPSQKQGDGQ